MATLFEELVIVRKKYDTCTDYKKSKYFLGYYKAIKERLFYRTFDHDPCEKEGYADGNAFVPTATNASITPESVNKRKNGRKAKRKKIPCTKTAA